MVLFSIMLWLALQNLGAVRIQGFYKGCHTLLHTWVQQVLQTLRQTWLEIDAHTIY
jgi:hypothetical protein